MNDARRRYAGTGPASTVFQYGWADNLNDIAELDIVASVSILEFVFSEQRLGQERSRTLNTIQSNDLTVVCFLVQALSSNTLSQGRRRDHLDASASTSSTRRRTLL
ncbi:hypothetical protein BGV51_06145 [Burkholderia ubonensis]|nr:hypothetical protein WM01_25545 [Burkholderia ubonensis]OJB01631.1 hypothetical protein BGV51_06145 [Burkholderia ubonensis]